MITILLAALALQAAPTTEAEALGLDLARSGTLATMLPIIQQKETEEMIAEHSDLTDAEKEQLRAAAAKAAGVGIHRIMVALGHAYATRLSTDDLRALVAFNQTPAALRYREVAPAVTAEAMQAIGEIDFERETLAAFCTETGKACPPPEDAPAR